MEGLHRSFRAMWRHLVMAALIAVRAQAFAPIQWAGLPSRKFVLAPMVSPIRASARNQASLPKLAVWDHHVWSSASEIPHFTVQADKTITWDDAGLCMEASGNNIGDAVRVNHCKGGPAQLWNVLPRGYGRHSQIKLDDAERCLGINDELGGLDGAPVELRACSDLVTEAWKFEEQFPVPRENTPSPFEIGSVVSMAALGALSLSALSLLWRRNSRVLVASQGRALLNVDEGSVCLVRSPLHQDNLSVTPSAEGSEQRMIPAAMALGMESGDSGHAELERARAALESIFSDGPRWSGTKYRLKLLNSMAKMKVLSDWLLQTKVLSNDGELREAHAKARDTLLQLRAFNPCLNVRPDVKGVQFLFALTDSDDGEGRILAVAGGQRESKRDRDMVIHITHLAVSPTALHSNDSSVREAMIETLQELEHIYQIPVNMSPLLEGCMPTVGGSGTPYKSHLKITREELEGLVRGRLEDQGEVVVKRTVEDIENAFDKVGTQVAKLVDFPGNTGSGVHQYVWSIFGPDASEASQKRWISDPGCFGKPIVLVQGDELYLVSDPVEKIVKLLA